MRPLAHRIFRSLLIAAGVAWASCAQAGSRDASMVLIPAGEYEPVLRGQDEPVRAAVAAFWLDTRPVTNAEFLEFVRANPKWRRSRVAPLFADDGYLGDWAGDLGLGPRAPADAPVVRVSWFAARAYAAWRGKRLPTTAEWERAAAAGFTTDRGEDEPAYREAALGWFASPAPDVLPGASDASFIISLSFCGALRAGLGSAEPASRHSPTSLCEVKDDASCISPIDS